MNSKKTNKNNRLGRGLSSLLGDENEKINNESKNGLRKEIQNKNEIIDIPIEWINPNPLQPRKIFEKDLLEELAKSIMEKGIFQPLLIRKAKDTSRYEIVAGERRWRAAQLAKKHEIPCIILDINDKEASEISLIENLQRRDLTSIEEAKGYTLLIQDHNYTHEELSEIVGKSRAHISNIIRLLSLPEKIINRLMKRELTMGQVRPLVGISNAEEIAEQVFLKNLSSREVEKIVKKKNLKINKSTVVKSADIIKLEENIRNKHGLNVKIKWNDITEVGNININLNSLEQFEYLLKNLKID